MPYQVKSVAEASRLLAEYEILNSDLPRDLRTQLAVFVLAPRVGKATLQELFGRPFGGTLYRHRSWLWYTALSTSGLESRWRDFADSYNRDGCLHHCLVWLKSVATEDQWTLLSKRLGISLVRAKKRNELNPHWWRHRPHSQSPRVWTKGGTWTRCNNFTRIIILGESLDNERDHSYNAVTRELTQNDCRVIERELHGLYDPDQMLAPHIITEAVQYVRRRIPGVLGYKRPHCSYKTTSWFFQTKVPHPRGGFVSYRNQTNKALRESDGYTIDWLPPVRPDAKPR